MNFFFFYLKGHKKGIALFLLFSFIFFITFALYHLPVAAVLYPVGICTLLGVLFLICDSIHAYGKHRLLKETQKLPASLMDSFPEKESQDDEDYQKIIGVLREEQRRLENQSALQISDMVDYYTIWAHQIKTPIASMKLNLQNEDSPLARTLSEDLFRIEQYVEMVLCYLRLNASSTDYVIQEYSLDGIVRQAVRKFAGQFIRKKIKLDFHPMQATVITDEKWLSFVIEQVISNALKYTSSGGTITIDMEFPKKLCIRDTGIGIAPEDLPRIFEKGYTGYNGRHDKKASGIGLYLCRRICENLGHRITANSSLESGTVIRIHLEQKTLKVE